MIVDSIDGNKINTDLVACYSKASMANIPDWACYGQDGFNFGNISDSTMKRIELDSNHPWVMGGMPVKFIGETDEK